MKQKLLVMVLLMTVFLVACTQTKIVTSEPEPQTPQELTYVLQLLALTNKRSYGYIIVSGQVKNISAERLSNVEALIQFYTEDGVFVKSDSALIEYNPIMPDQTSPFEVTTTDNPAITNYEVNFKFLMGEGIPI